MPSARQECKLSRLQMFVNQTPHEEVSHNHVRKWVLVSKTINFCTYPLLLQNSKNKSDQQTTNKIVFNQSVLLVVQMSLSQFLFIFHSHKTSTKFPLFQLNKSRKLPQKRWKFLDKLPHLKVEAY